MIVLSYEPRIGSAPCLSNDLMKREYDRRRNSQDKESKLEYWAEGCSGAKLSAIEWRPGRIF